MKKKLLVSLLFVTIFSNAQVGIGTNNPVSSSILDISSTEKGLLLPRLTNSQKNSIVSPAAGLWIWCTDCGTSGEMQVYNGSAWTTISSKTPPSELTYTGSSFIFAKGHVITPLVASINTEDAVNYAVNPALPQGLTLNSVTGVITGTPIGVSSSSIYTITASNSVGSTTTTIAITVNEVVLDNLGLTTATPIVSAYSLRKLSSTYTGSAIRVRRSSDNVETDIGFDSSGNLNETALTSFIGGNSGFVVTWYDQSGKGNHVTQATTTHQPRIVNTGVIDKRNGKPVVYYSNTPQLLSANVNTEGLPNSMYGIGGVDNITGSSLLDMVHVGTVNGVVMSIGGSGQVVAAKRGQVGLFTTTYVTANSLNAIVMISPSNIVATQIFVNGTQATITSGATLEPLAPSANITLGGLGDVGGTSYNSFVSEILIFSGISTTMTRQMIEANQVVYYSLPPSGLTYKDSSFSYIVNTAITPIAPPTNGGGVPTSYTISPALPTGLLLNSATGAITGTPTAVTAKNSYTVTATNSGGSTTTTISITVKFTLDRLGLTHANPANAAYSLRKLSSSYIGSAIRVRRSSDNVETDIGFDGLGNLDQSALTTFIGVNSGYVVTWYDQSGFNNHAIQLTPSLQPRIVNAGNVEFFNGKPAIFFNKAYLSGKTDDFSYPNTINGVVGSVSSIATGTFLSIGNNDGPGFGLGNYLITSSTNYSITGIKGRVNYLSTNTTLPINTTAVMTMNTLTDGLATTMKLNGTNLTITSGATDTPIPASAVVNIGSNSTMGVTKLYNSYIQEGLFFNSTLSPSLLQALENNQSVYYSAKPAALTYSSSSFTFIRNTAITPIATPTNTGGAVTSYSVNPALPSGLLLNSITGAITGTPTIDSAATTYTITASNGFGSTTTTISITVNGFTLDKLGLTHAILANAAYSLRKLSSSYTGPAIRVRRSSDNVETDIGFDGLGNIDQSALTTFIGANSGYVVTWYDQSGFNSHATQLTPSSQPRIVNAGNVEFFNGKPAIFFNRTHLSGNTGAFAYPNTINGVVGTISSTVTGTFLSIGSYNGSGFGLGDYFLRSNYNRITGFKEPVIFLPTNTTLLINTTAVITMNTLTGGLATTMKLNGTNITVTNGATDAPIPASAVVNIGGLSFAELHNSYVQEGLFFNSTLSPSLLQTLENNQSVYYSAKPVALTYSGSSFTYNRNTAITPIATPTNTGGAVTSYSVSPALPSGLQLNSVTGAITGTPTTVSAPTTYTITASNGFGSTTTTISITVNGFTLDKLGLTHANPATAAYSLRKLSSSYTGSAIRVRRSSDNVETDIGFDGSGNLNETALTTFIGGNSGFVVTWYDQSGVGNHVTQTVMSNQPRIVNAGVVDKRNDKPAVYFNVKNLVSPAITALSGSNASVTMSGVMMPLSTSMYSHFWATGSANGAHLGFDVGFNSAGTNLYVGSNSVSGNAGGSTISLNNMHTVSSIYSGTGATAYLDGVQSVGSSITFNYSSTGSINIGGTRNIASSFNGYISELVTFSSALTTTVRQVIEANQGLYYIAPKALTYTGSPFTYMANNAITPIAAPTYTGGAPTNYTISPALPTGLLLNSATGAITGTPTIASAATTYTVTATNTFGSSATNLNIAVNLVLDNLINPKAAFSLRKLRTNYTGPAIRVNRSSDNSEQDIGFTASGNLDETALINFVTNNGTNSTANGFVVTWYDQSGLNNHVYSGLYSPKIVSSGSIIKRSGKPVIYFEHGTGQHLKRTVGLGIPNTMINVGGIDNSNSNLLMSHIGLSDGNAITIQSGRNIVGEKVGQVNLPTNSFATEKVLNIVSMVQPLGTNASTIFLNTAATTITSGATFALNGSPKFLCIGGILYTGYTQYSNSSFMSESIIFDSELSTTNRRTIENNQYAFYMAPSISYPSTNKVTLGATNLISPTLLGGPIISYSISPALSAGLSFNTATGQITGTPVAVIPDVTYTVTATNLVGSTTATLSISTINYTLDKLGFTNTDIKAAAAYSLRKLRSNYTGNAILVRRSSDNVTQAIGFDGLGNIDQSALTTFIGANSGYVVTWYDQSGLNNHATQLTPSLQPRIVNAGNIEFFNGKPAIFFNKAYLSGKTDNFTYPNTINGVVGTISSTATGAFLSIGNNDGPGFGLGNNLSTTSTNYSITGIKGRVAYLTTNTTLLTNTTAVMTMNTLTGGLATTMKLNGTNLTITSGATNTPIPVSAVVNIGSNSTTGSVSELYNSYIQEGLFFNSTLSPSLLQTLENNQNVFYSAKPAALTYSSSSFTYNRNTAITPIATPTNTGGAVTSYSVSPALPSGLLLNSVTGAITGTPTTVSAPTTYTITASNGFGSTTTTISITVNGFTLDKLGLTHANPATAAYSLRKLSTSYTGSAIRVRRSSDNVETDIGFDGLGNLNETALTTFIGGNSGFVVTWYDQSGVGNHVTQTVMSNQPRIVNAGVIDKRNGKPVVYYLNTAQFLFANVFTGGLPNSMYGIGGVDNITGSSGLVLAHIGTNNGVAMSISDLGQVVAVKRGQVGVITTTYVTGNSLNAIVMTSPSNNVATQIFVNGTQATITSGATLVPLAPSARITLGALGDVGGSSSNSFVSEILIFSGISTTTTRQTIEANQAVYYTLAPKALTYTGSPFTFTANSAITSIATPTNAGGAPTNYTIRPALPTGLLLNSATGAITGTPTNALAATTYTVTAANAFGSSATNLNITVNLVLDNLINPKAAFSLRKLRTNYTGNAIRVRRSSNNSEQDIGFTASGNLDEKALVNFVTNNGANSKANGFVVTWYDQSGFNNHIEKSRIKNQPQIVSNGSVIKRSGKPVVYFAQGAKQCLDNSTLQLDISNTVINVGGIDNLNSASLVMSHIGSTNGNAIKIEKGSGITGEKVGRVEVATNSFATAKVFNIVSLVYPSPSKNISIFLNTAATTITTGAAATVYYPDNGFLIGATGFGYNDDFSANSFMSESIIFDSELSTTIRRTIENNQYAFYNSP